MISRRTTLRALLGALTIVSVGCLAPTLPIPPPSFPEEVVGPDAEGLVHLRGGKGSAMAGAYVTVWNLRLERGRTSRAAADGTWSEAVPAESKDTLYVWQELGNERSDSIEIKVP